MMDQISVLFIDLDDTVYPSSLNIWPFFMERIQSYLREVLGIEQEDTVALQHRLFLQYGTTLRGLQVEYGIDMHEYLDWVHSIDLSAHVFPDPELRKALQSLPQPKWIFTNASVAHAENILGLMNLRDLFVDIIDVVATSPYCKPQPGSYEIALKLAGNPMPEHCLFLDDRSDNLDTARKLGIHTLQVKPVPDGKHPSISHLIHLPDYLRNNNHKKSI